MVAVVVRVAGITLAGYIPSFVCHVCRNDGLAAVRHSGLLPRPLPWLAVTRTVNCSACRTLV